MQGLYLTSDRETFKNNYYSVDASEVLQNLSEADMDELASQVQGDLHEFENPFEGEYLGD